MPIARLARLQRASPALKVWRGTPALPIFVCANIFRAKILAENKFNNALFDVTDKAALMTGANTSILDFMVIAQFDPCADVMLVNRRRESLEALLAQFEGGLIAIDLC